MILKPKRGIVTKQERSFNAAAAVLLLLLLLLLLRLLLLLLLLLCCCSFIHSNGADGIVTKKERSANFWDCSDPYVEIKVH